MGRAAWLKTFGRGFYAPPGGLRHEGERLAGYPLTRAERRAYARQVRRDARDARLLTAKRGVPGLSQPTVADVYRYRFAKLNDRHTAPATSRF